MSRQNRSLANMSSPAYGDIQYGCIDDLITDVAALCNKFKDMMAYKIDADTTIKGSIFHAFSPQCIGYVLNFGRFVSRNPTIPVPYGTARNEAWHKELKAFFANVYYQTGRNAALVGKVATMVKLVAGMLDKEITTAHEPQHQLIHAAMIAWSRSNVELIPKVACRATPNPHVDMNALPAGVTVCRKRPAQQ